MTILTCPDEQQLRDFVLGRLTEESSGSVNQHVESCQSCDALLNEIDQCSDDLVVAIRRLPPQPVSPSSTELQQSLSKIADFQTAVELDTHIDTSSTLHAESVVVSESPSSLREYEILESIGFGGMGTVFKARHRDLKRLAAIKIISPDRLRDANLSQRFQREIRAVASLDHPNVVRATDAGCVDGIHFLVMEYVDGANVSDLVSKSQSLSVANACEIVRQTSLALQHAHEGGLIHRDVKPSNVMLTRRGQVKLLDLGLARWQLDDNSFDELTASNRIIGTADYIAPEQVKLTGSVSPQTDLYGLGCMFFKLLTGNAPFAHELNASALGKLMAHVNTPPPDVAAFRDDVPEDVVVLLRSLLAKDAERRPHSAADVADMLSAHASGSDLSQLFLDHERDSSQRVELSSDEIPDYVQRLFSEERKAALIPVSSLAFSRLLIAAVLVVVVASGVIFAPQVLNQLKQNQPTGPIAKGTTNSGPMQSSAPPVSTPAPDWLATQVPSPGATDQDGNHLPEGAIGRLGSVNLRHGGDILNIEFSNDGKRLISAGQDRTVRIWDSATGQELKTFSINRRAQWSMDVAPDGTTIALATETAGVIVWNASNSRVLQKLAGSSNVRRIAFDLDGSRLAGANADGNVLVWSMSDGRLQANFPAHVRQATNVAFSPAGKLIASTGIDGYLRIWNSQTHRQEWEFNAVSKSSQSDRGEVIASMSWHPDETHIAVGLSNGDVLVLDWDTKRVTRRWRASDNRVSEVLFSPDGQRLATAGDRGAREWDWRSGEQTYLGKPHHGYVSCVTYSPDGSVMATGGTTRRGTFPNQNQLYFDRTIQLSKIATDESVTGTKHDSFALSDVVFTPNGKRIFTATRDGSLVVWDSQTRQLIDSVSNLDSSDPKVALSPNSRFACVSNKQQVLVYDAATLNRMAALRVANGEAKDLVFSPDGSKLAAGLSSGLVQVWESGTWRPASLSKRLGVFIGRIAWAPNGSVIAIAGWDGTVCLLNAATGEELARQRPHRKRIRALEFSRDGRFLVSGDEDSWLCVYEAATGELIHNEQTEAGISSLAFSNDFRTLFTCDYVDRLRLWDLATMTPYLTRIGRPGTGANAASISPDRSQLAVAHRDGTALLWDCSRLQQSRPVDEKSKVNTKQSKRLWADLRSKDAAVGMRAVWSLGLSENQDDVATFVAERLSESKIKSPTGLVVTDADQIQIVRAIQAIEYMGSVSARIALNKLAAAESDLLTTQEAKAALSRFDSSPKP